MYYIHHMKNLLLPLSFILICSGCYQYGQSTYPTLDGEYVLNSIVIQSEHGETVEYEDPFSFVYPNPIGPLDSLKVNKTRIHISGIEFRIGYRYVNYQDEWDYLYYFDINRDPLSGEWEYMKIEYMVNEVLYPRNFVILEDNAESIKLRGPTRVVDNVKYHYTLSFDRIGP